MQMIACEHHSNFGRVHRARSIPYMGGSHAEAQNYVGPLGYHTLAVPSWSVGTAYAVKGAEGPFMAS